MCYSDYYQMYLIVTTDFKLHIINEFFTYVGSYPLKLRTIKFIFFDDKNSQIIAAGIDGCYSVKYVTINKYKPKQSLELDPESNFVSGMIGPPRALEKTPVWVKGCKIINDQFICTWSQLSLTIHSLKTLKLKFYFEELLSSDNFVTDMLISIIH